jgi:hypothetical protein
MAEIRTGNLCNGKLIASLLHQRQMQKKSITSRPSPIFTIFRMFILFLIFVLKLKLVLFIVINYRALERLRGLKHSDRLELHWYW